MSDAPRDAKAPETVDPDAFARVVAAVRAVRVPESVGPYKVLGVLGEGGMGTVYRAAQAGPLRREIALKVIKLGRDTRDVLARFEIERQMLARMSHPNIARVYDAGASDDGRPYFAMECVDGLPITTYADQHRLSIRERLQLFLQVCDAVQHAHQKAIIHRDLKPGNLLVADAEGRAVVKVIDFGIAKVLEGDADRGTMITLHGTSVGTPGYMAPEQLHNPVDADTRSDVYALGAVLYELLTGSIPVDVKSVRQDSAALARVISESEPERPSTRVTGASVDSAAVANNRAATVEGLRRTLRRELEWIPLKALRVDRAERYATVSAMAADVESYLANRPLVAGPDSAAYRVRKFVRRHRATVSAAGVVLALVTAGVGGTLWQAARARAAERDAVAQRAVAESQRQRAESNAEELRDVNRFLTHDVIAAATPDVARGRELTMRDALTHASASVGERFRDRPGSEAAVRGALADAYASLRLLDEARKHAFASVDAAKRAYGDDHDATIDASRRLGWILMLRSELSAAEPMLRDAADRARRLLGAEHDVTIQAEAELANCLRRLGRFDQAEPLLRDVLERVERRHGRRSEEAADVMNNLAVLLSTKGDYAQAVVFFRRCVEVARELGGDHPDVFTGLSNLAKTLQNAGDLEEAESAMAEALAGRRRVLGDDHRQTLLSMNDLSWILTERRQFAEAIAIGREGLERRRRTLGDDDPDTLQSSNALARTLLAAGEIGEAELLFRFTVEARRRVHGPRHRLTLGTMSHLAWVYERQDRLDDAAPLLAELCSPEAVRAISPDLAASAAIRHARCLLRGNDASAVAAVDAAMAAFARIEDAPPYADEAASEVADLLAARGEADRSARWRDAVARWKSAP